MDVVSEVPPLRGVMPSRAELLVGGAVFPPKHLKDISMVSCGFTDLFCSLTVL